MLKPIRRAWRAARELPPRAVIDRAGRRLARPFSRRRDLAAARRRCGAPGGRRWAAAGERFFYGGLLPYRPEPGAVRRLLAEAGLQGAVRELAREAAVHRFDLLGSGPVQVSCFTAAAGFAGCRYAMAPGRERRDLIRRRMAEALKLQPRGAEEEGAGGAILREALRQYEPVDWHLDFRSGYRWDPGAWYRDIAPAEQPGAEIKIPWELSRFQHLGALGLAYLLAESAEAAERTAAEAALQLADWIAANPPRCGVNWSCPMDVAIRAVNWLWALSVFGESAAFTAPLKRLLGWSLGEHALFLRGNLENRGPFVGNHYLANLAGMIHLEAALPGLPQSDRRLAFAAAELAREMGRQVRPDGTHFEASTGYHGLVTEFFLRPALLLARLPAERRERLRRFAGSEGVDFSRPAVFPEWFWRRLLQMVRYLADLTAPGGELPRFGDFDSGRLCKLTPAVLFDPAAGRRREAHGDYRPLLAAAGRAYGLAELRQAGEPYALEGELAAGGLPPEAAAALCEAAAAARGAGEGGAPAGPPQGERKDGLPKMAACDIFAQSGAPVTSLFELAPGSPSAGAAGALSGPAAGPAYYPEAGVAVYRWGPFYAAITAGPHGAEGWGVHTHNDKLSFHLNIAGLDFVVDPGSFTYTALPEERNAFRSTIYHNTVVLPGLEQNRWAPGPGGLFTLPEQCRAAVLEAGRDRFRACLEGYGPGICRLFRFTGRGLSVEDRLGGAGPFLVVYNLHPAVRVEQQGPGRFLLRRESVAVTLTVAGGGGALQGWVEEGGYSSGYGIKEPAARIVVRAAG